MKKLYFMSIILLLVTISLNAASQSRVKLVKNTQINEYTNAILGYTTVAKSCGHTNAFNKLKPRLIQLLGITNKKNSLTKDGKNLLNNTNYYISIGVDEFNRKPYITCDEANRYYVTLISSIDPIINANK